MLLHVRGTPPVVSACSASCIPASPAGANPVARELSTAQRDDKLQKFKCKKDYNIYIVSVLESRDNILHVVDDCEDGELH